MTLPTVKLSDAEWLALAVAAVKDIGEQPIRDVMMDVLGGDRYDRLVNQKLSTPTTKPENHALIRGIYPHIPGKQRAEKERYLIDLGRRVFQDDARFMQVLAYVNHRVAAFEDAGGTVAYFPDPKHIVDEIGVWYGGVRMAGASLDPDYDLTVSPDGRNWSTMPDSWQDGSGMLFPAICAAAHQRADGIWVGGKYEWLPRKVNAHPRGWGNIRNEYGGWVPPARGTEMLVWAYTSIGHRVSNTVKCIF
jgi:hypothetical protein